MAPLSIASSYKLKTGYDIPILGFGTAGDVEAKYKLEDIETHTAVKQALKVGYRHIDSAQMYGTERAIGQAFKASALNRSDIFVTSKTRTNGYQETKDAIETGLKESGLEFFDLYLPHSPYGGTLARKGTWRALVEAKEAGKIRSLGVSNFGVHHMEEIESFIAELESELGHGNGGEISVGQWELHPWLHRPDIVNFCRDRNIVIEAYCPLIRGQRMEEPVIKTLSQKYGKSGAQTLIHWSLQKGYVPLPKSATPLRIAANADVFDFELSSEDMKLLETDDCAPCTWNPAAAPLEK
ncbi:hypothetical protein H2200_007251 [Cladophialophora chaetospira]|uniref:D-xylose reductase [NAD(P)H] n=1 Tax=Cladophialophora chaetospira TaxID=386627 RepID=A0AA39CHH0_9EURO|nr:hypothetical protein H2200_007251 [Cladophialophora chaetospira]